jgi:hypothetical protein
MLYVIFSLLLVSWLSRWQQLNHCLNGTCAWFFVCFVCPFAYINIGLWTDERLNCRHRHPAIATAVTITITTGRILTLLTNSTALHFTASGAPRPIAFEMK